MFKISVGRDPKILTVAATVENSTSLPPCSKLNSQLTLFQNPQFLRIISSRPEVILIAVPFPVWGFIMTMVIVISFVRERKTVPNDYATELLTRIAQSPTKLNDRI